MEKVLVWTNKFKDLIQEALVINSVVYLDAEQFEVLELITITAKTLTNWVKKETQVSSEFDTF